MYMDNKSSKYMYMDNKLNEHMYISIWYMVIGIGLCVHYVVFNVHREYDCFSTDVCMYLGETSYIYSYILPILVHLQFRNIKIKEAWSKFLVVLQQHVKLTAAQKYITPVNLNCIKIKIWLIIIGFY